MIQIINYIISKIREPYNTNLKYINYINYFKFKFT